MEFSNIQGWSPRFLVALLLTGSMAIASTAQFEAPAPGALLEPVGNAASMIRLIQGNNTVLWTSNGPSVDSVRVQGWPVETGTDVLGGGVMISKASGDNGVIAFGERPMSLGFLLDH